MQEILSKQLNSLRNYCMHVQLTIVQVSVRHKGNHMKYSVIEYVLLAFLAFCVISLGANAFEKHADKFKAPFRTINRALTMGARQ